jgi:hypothetical protein
MSQRSSSALGGERVTPSSPTTGAVGRGLLTTFSSRIGRVAAGTIDLSSSCRIAAGAGRVVIWLPAARFWMS